MPEAEYDGRTFGIETLAMFKGCSAHGAAKHGASDGYPACLRSGIARNLDMDTGEGDMDSEFV